MAKVYLSILLHLVTIVTYGNSKGGETEAIDFVQKVLVSGQHKFEVYMKDVPSDLQVILIQYRESTDQNKVWYENYAKLNSYKKPLPYHKNFGVTEAEYNRLMNEYPVLKMKLKGLPTLSITSKDNLITFKGESTFLMFDGVIFNTKDNTLLVNDQKIPFASEINTIEGFGEVKGYVWKFESGNTLDAITKNLDYSKIEISIGKKDDGNILIQYANVYIEEGTRKITGTVSGILK